MNKKQVLIWLIWLGVLIFAGIVSLNMPSFQSVQKGNLYDPPFYRWDSVWYISIADGGYNYSTEHNSSIAFFPLYPFIIYIVNAITSLRLGWSGFLASIIFAFLSSYIFLKLLELDYNKSESEKIWLIWLFYPASFFLVSVYAESLFIFLSLLAFYFARKNQWLKWGVAAAFLVITKPYGVFILPVSVYEHWKMTGKIFNKYLIFPIVSLGIFFIYNYLKFGTFLAFAKTQTTWGRSFANPFLIVISYTKHIFVNGLKSEPYLVINLGALLFFFVGILLFMLKRGKPSYILYSVLLIVPAIFSGTFTSLYRYVLSSFAIFLGIGLFLTNHKYFFGLYLAISASLLILFASYFVRFYPIF